MKAQWYGDKRDLVKWATLVHLCRSNKLKAIVQIAFLQKEDSSVTPLLMDDEPVEFSQEVWKHFRDLHHIKNLEDKTDLKIIVLDEEFSHGRRQEYLVSVLSKLNRIGDRKVVLLDPDTGMEPEKANGKHVRREEVEQFWGKLKKGDWLVLYQHAQRKPEWEKIQKDAFVKACKGAEVYNTFKGDKKCDKVAHDVVFYAAEKR